MDDSGLFTKYIGCSNSMYQCEQVRTNIKNNLVAKQRCSANQGMYKEGSWLGYGTIPSPLGTCQGNSTCPAEAAPAPVIGGDGHDNNTFTNGTADPNAYECNDPTFPFKNTKYGLCYKTDPGPSGNAAAFQACNPPGHSFSLVNYPLCVVPAETTPADAPAAPTVVPVSATFIDNEGGEHPNTPVVKVGELYVVGIKQGGWFKMVAMNAQGIEVNQLRYMA